MQKKNLLYSIDDSTQYYKIFRSVLDCMPLLDLDKGPWLAGGAVRRLLEGVEEYGWWDFDFFFSSQEEYLQWCNHLRDIPDTETLYESKNALTVKMLLDNEHCDMIDEDVIIQLISRDWHKSVTDLLDTFDFRMSQCATDGETLVVGDKTLHDIYEQVLTFNTRYKAAETSAVATVRRIAKFHKQGYNIKSYHIYSFLHEVAKNPKCIEIPAVSDDAYEQRLQT